MAHSYIYAKNNLGTDRSVTIPDGALRVFMILFNEVSKSLILNNKERKVCDHYHIEILEWHSSYMDALLQRIASDSKLKSWYLSILTMIETKLTDMGDYIDNNYLNEFNKSPTLGGNYPEPVNTSVIKSLLNDIYWILVERNKPSGDYKWFEENIR